MKILKEYAVELVVIVLSVAVFAYVWHVDNNKSEPEVMDIQSQIEQAQ